MQSKHEKFTLNQRIVCIRDFYFFILKADPDHDCTAWTNTQTQLCFKKNFERPDQQIIDILVPDP
jgi:hypothetical protein